MRREMLPPVPRGTILSDAWRFFVNCLAKQNYSRMRGRAGRMEFWSATIIGAFFTILPLFFIIIPCSLIRWISLTAILVAVLYLAMPLLSVNVRRLHDVGFSGWWLVFLYVTYCVPFSYVIFTLSVHIGLEPQLIENPDELYHILLDSCREFWLVCVHAIAEILSLILFVLTLLPGNKGFNKYDC